jgi:hypothetical protein
MNSRQSKIPGIFSLVVPFTIGVCVSPCIGQQLQPLSSKQLLQCQSGISGKAVKDTNETVLREPMELQDLPRFTGHEKFQGGHTRTTDDGQGCSMEFAVQEPPDRVFDWYKTVLQMNQWKVANTNSSEILVATKNKNRCTIGVYPTRDKQKWTTHLHINYFLGNSSR